MNRPNRNLPKKWYLLLLGLLALAAVSAACSQQASNQPATSEPEGTQVASNDNAQPGTPPSEPAAPPQQSPPAKPAPSRAATGNPAPSAPPIPKTIAVTVPEATQLRVKIQDNLNSGANHEGDTFRATLLQPVIVGDRVVLPEGSSIEGTVTGVVPAKKGMKESGGSLTLSFDRIATPSGASAPMAASFSQQAKSTGKKAGTIGGAAAGGALLGKVLGGSTKDAAVGAVVGGAIGTGVAAGTKGSELKIAAGTEMTITLEKPITLELRR